MGMRTCGVSHEAAQRSENNGDVLADVGPPDDGRDPERYGHRTPEALRLFDEFVGGQTW